MSDAASRPTTEPAEEHERAPPRPLLSNIFAKLNTLVRRRESENTVREEIADILAEDALDTELAPMERAMLSNLLAFGALRVSDVMVPRADIIGVEASATLPELLRIFREAQHSRLPVYRETLDEPVGMIHVKDLIEFLVPGDEVNAKTFSMSSMTRAVLFVPPSMPAMDLLIKMQATRVHLALVVDEYGGTDGLVSIEDLVEQIVGDIDDEHDTDEDPRLTARADGGFDADARVPIQQLEKAVGLTLVDEEEREELDTLGGLVGSLVGRVPQRGEIVPHPAGLEFEIVDADPRRIKRVRIHRTRAVDALDSAAGEAAREADARARVGGD